MIAPATQRGDAPRNHGHTFEKGCVDPRNSDQLNQSGIVPQPQKPVENDPASSGSNDPRKYGGASNTVFSAGHQYDDRIPHMDSSSPPQKCEGTSPAGERYDSPRDVYDGSSMDPVVPESQLHVSDFEWPPQYLPLPPAAQRFVAELEAVKRTGPSANSRYHDPEWTTLSEYKRSERAHAAMIEGKSFGVEAIYPCKDCKHAPDPCRMYHPILHEIAWRSGLEQGIVPGVGYSCSSCRARKRKGPPCNAS